MASSSAFFTGTLRLRCGESAPSAMSHFAAGSMPVSSSRVESLTPVHSAQETSPCSACTVSCIGSGENIGALLPPHSRNETREVMG
jgi:hypothetical protein